MPASGTVCEKAFLRHQVKPIPPQIQATLENRDARGRYLGPSRHHVGISCGIVPPDQQAKTSGIDSSLPLIFFGDKCPHALEGQISLYLLGQPVVGAVDRLDKVS